MAPSLPSNSSLERFRRNARRLQRAVRRNDAETLALVARHHPDGWPDDPVTFALTAAQHVIARTVGFTSWPRLQAYLSTAEEFRCDPTVVAADDPVSNLLSLACLTCSQDDGPAVGAADAVHRADPVLRRGRGRPGQTTPAPGR